MSAKQKSAAMHMVPAHIALIPDGNRRWSSAHKARLLDGYSLGIKKFIDFSVWLKSFGVKTLTVWALSLENINRRKNTELNVLYSLYIRAAYDKEILKKLDNCKARVKIIGMKELLPPKVREALESVEKRTSKYDKFTINLLVAYSGRADLVQAIKNTVASTSSYACAIADIQEDAIRRNLMTAELPDADLIIRTSGEKRLSGFLPWQSTYSELYFAKKCWPDFQKEDLRRALHEFSSRHRRFGK